jgi:hypothetical protein
MTQERFALFAEFLVIFSTLWIKKSMNNLLSSEEFPSAFPTYIELLGQCTLLYFKYYQLDYEKSLKIYRYCLSSYRSYIAGLHKIYIFEIHPVYILQRYCTDNTYH